MAKRGMKITRKKFDQLVKDGRGQGEGLNYNPWIHVTDIASAGFSTMYKSMTIGRVHHVLSNRELALLQIYDWNSKIVDIREQYPLLDENKSVQEVQEIANDLGIKYSLRNRKEEIYVPTTDFLLNVIDDRGNISLKARTCKSIKELENPRTIEKLQIDKCYWEKRNVDWKIVTENEIDMVYVNNIRYFLPYYNLNNYGIDRVITRYVEEKLEIAFATGNDEWSTELAEIDIQLKVNRGTALMVFKNLICNKQWKINMEKPINVPNDIEVIERGDKHK